MSETPWLDSQQLTSWMRLVAVLELLPGVLDSQLQRDADISHIEYFVMSVLSEAPERTLRMTRLAESTNSTLPRLSHVVARLEKRGYITRSPCADDRRATNATLTELGWDKVVSTAPGHVTNVREFVIDALTPEQLVQLGEISEQLLTRLDPERRLVASARADPGDGEQSR